MKNVLIIILLLFSVNIADAQLIATISSDIPKLAVKKDVQILSELTWNVNELNDSKIQIKLLQKQLQFQNISIYTDNLGYRYILGVTSNYTSNIELVLKNKQLVFGNLTDDATDYVILVREGRYFLAEKMETYQALQECDTSETEDNTSKKYEVNFKDESKSAGVSTDDNCNVRLLVLYTDDVADANTDAELTIQTAVARMNTSYDNSLINHNVEIALIEEVNFNEFDADGNPKMSWITKDQLADPSDGVLDYIHDLCDLYDADMVQLVTSQIASINADGDTISICGSANAIFATSSSVAFAITRFSCLDEANDHSLAHEFGHLYGCRHDIGVDDSTTPYPFGHGHVNADEGWRTIMAYGTTCTDAPCPRISYFSNPSVDHPTTGSPTGVAGVSDNETAIGSSYSHIVNLQNTPTDKVVWDSDTVVDGDIANIRGETSITTDETQPYTIQSGGVATFIAGNSITLLRGFRATPGSSFRAFVGTCTETE